VGREVPVGTGLVGCLAVDWRGRRGGRVSEWLSGCVIERRQQRA
jgi:hypothetical protein